jgi:hypothetical protein
MSTPQPVLSMDAQCMRDIQEACADMIKEQEVAKVKYQLKCDQIIERYKTQLETDRSNQDSSM